jgi:hypothetical protein
MRIILNVGLKIGRTNETIGLDLVERSIRQIFGLALRYSISEHGSDTEPTAVVSFEYSGSELGNYQGVHGLIRQMAQATQQEVIPAYKPERMKGVMLGATIDLDDSWGDFNPAYFIMPDGSRLGATLPAAA